MVIVWLLAVMLGVAAVWFAMSTRVIKQYERGAGL